MVKALQAAILPARSMTRWLAEPVGDPPREVRLALISSLYGSLPIFIGGILNTIAVSLLIAVRNPSPLFIAWAAVEILLCLVRVPLILSGKRAVAEGGPGPVSLYMLLALAWAASIGFGTFICMVSGDWVSATLACLSSAAMVGGIAFRNFAAPRLVGGMIALSFGPAAIGGLCSGETVLLIVSAQIPLYLISMTTAAFHLNKMMVRTMLAERDSDHRARHDALTGVLNRAGLAQEVAERMARSTPFTLYYLDLDGFKGINDTLGHQVGDEVLKSVALRLRHLASDGDTVARMGGDEFVMLCEGTDPSVARGFGQEIVRTVGHTGYVIGSEAAFVGASIGAALYPDHGTDLGTLLGEADTALYQAKFWGRARCVLAHSETHSPQDLTKQTMSRPEPLILDRNAA